MVGVRRGDQRLSLQTLGPHLRHNNHSQRNKVAGPNHSSSSPLARSLQIAILLRPPGSSKVLRLGEALARLGQHKSQRPSTVAAKQTGPCCRNTGPQGRLGIVRVEEGKDPGRVYEVRKDSLSIGRSRESDIFLEDLAVSRLHASIVNMGNGNYGLKDEGSANGTKINGQLVPKNQMYPLQEGDKIQLGQTVLVFGKR